MRQDELPKIRTPSKVQILDNNEDHYPKKEAELNFLSRLRRKSSLLITDFLNLRLPDDSWSTSPPRSRSSSVGLRKQGSLDVESRRRRAIRSRRKSIPAYLGQGKLSKIIWNDLIFYSRLWIQEPKHQNRWWFLRQLSGQDCQDEQQSEKWWR